MFSRPDTVEQTSIKLEEVIVNTKPIVVVPWDFSPHAQNALDFSIEYYGSDCIHVICVLGNENRDMGNENRDRST